MCALAERAWSKEPDWAAIDDLGLLKNAIDTDWNEFANRLGQLELPRLDNLFGGVRYRIPLPGAKIEDGLLMANTPLPGLTIRYTTDGTEPTETSAVFEQPIQVNSHLVKLRIFSSNGRRSSRTTTVKR
jgi:hexosaminidase